MAAPLPWNRRAHEFIQSTSRWLLGAMVLLLVAQEWMPLFWRRCIGLPVIACLVLCVGEGVCVDMVRSGFSRKQFLFWALFCAVHLFIPMAVASIWGRKAGAETFRWVATPLIWVLEALRMPAYYSTWSYNLALAHPWLTAALFGGGLAVSWTADAFDPVVRPVRML